MSNLSLVDVLKKFHEILKPKFYLEIGGDGCSYVTLANPATKVIGVHHWPIVDIKKLPQNITVYPVATDYFFHSPYMLHDLHPDLILIDGYNKFEQIMKAFVCCEELAEPNATILIHDTSPTDPSTAFRQKFGDPNIPKYGDGYKFLSILAQRKDLKVDQLIFDSGLTVVTNLDKTDTLFHERMAYLIRDFLDLPLDKRETKFDITPEQYFNTPDKSGDVNIHIS